MDRPLARNTDPLTSHTAVMETAGARNRQHIELARLVRNNPGLTYRQLWNEHIADYRRRGIAEYLFREPVAIMRRLGEVATRGMEVRCPISGRMVSAWYPK